MKKIKAFSLIELSIVILIIGILIAGTLQASKIMRTSRLNTARSLTQSSEVPAIPDLILWLDATAEGVLTNSANSTKVGNNETIQAWKDQSPQAFSKFSFTQATAGNRPIYLIDGINNLPTIYFDANTAATTGDSLSTPNIFNLNPSQFTIFAVVRPMEATTGWGSIYTTRPLAGTQYGFNLYKTANAATFEFWAGTGSGWLQVVDSSAFTYNTPYILTGVRDSTSNTIFRNGVQKATGAGTYAVNTDTTSIVVIGNGTNSTYYFDGYISEIIMYDRNISVEDRQTVEKYLSKKYNIKLG